MRPRPGPDERLDRLCGELRIFQLRHGHRYATDDVLVAWAALEARPRALRVLDLGAGVGSVGLMVLDGLSARARLTSVELQQVSVSLARKTVAWNGLQGRVDLRHGDLREPGLLEDCEGFDLVVANPPYLRPNDGPHSPNEQKLRARFELYGDVFDYCRTAAARLADHGAFCFCFAASDRRPERAIEASGLRLQARQEVQFRRDRKAAIALFRCGWRGSRQDLEPLCVRDEHGARSAAFRAVRRRVNIEA
jgi:tRNA1(Val) A37 N6-methylase TrmN6